MTTPSGTPDELGPDATPEQEAFVRGLLGGLRADDPPMPDHVVARLDAALAEERRSVAAAPLAGGVPLAGADETPDAAATGGSPVAPVTVLPQQRRRPDRSTTALQWLVGAAAAVLVVGGVGAVVRGTFSTGSDSAATSAGGSRLLATGTTYTKDTLAEQARTLVTEPATAATNQGATGAPGTGTELDPEIDDRSEEPGAPASEGPTESPATGETPVPGDAGATGALDLAGCLQQLTGTTGTDPVAVDQATYEGRAAVVIVLASSDAPGSLDVWVVAPTCRLGEEAFLEFQRIDAP